MRAIVCNRFGDFHDLRVEEFPVPELLPHGVRIAVEYASLSFSISLWIAGKYQVKPSLPFVPGAEVVGRVVEIAQGVTACRVGQRVLAFIGYGGYAEYAVSLESTVYPLPDEIGSAAALHLGVSYCTALGGLAWRAQLKAGQTLLVLGAAGGVGLAAVEVGRALGARVIATASGANKCAACREHGADATIDHCNETLREASRRLAPQGVDVVFDPVGGELSEVAFRCLRPEGRLITIGFASGKMPQFQANVLLVKNLAVMGFNFGAYIGWSSVDERKYHEPKVRNLLLQLYEWTKEGKIRPYVSEVYPLDRFAEAMDSLLGRRTVGKVVLRVAT